MKQKLSLSWISSKQPRKQIKYSKNAKLHTRHKFLNAQLSKPLREKYGKRSFPLRKGDDVLVMRGSFKKKKAKITSVDSKKSRIVLENIQRSKKDGTKVNVYFHPSTLQIQSFNIDDKKRLAALNKKDSKEKKNAPEKTKSNN
jgi:large subunit ribosomal protein L24